MNTFYTAEPSKYRLLGLAIFSYMVSRTVVQFLSGLATHRASIVSNQPYVLDPPLHVSLPVKLRRMCVANCSCHTFSVILW